MFLILLLDFLYYSIESTQVVVTLNGSVNLFTYKEKEYLPRCMQFTFSSF